MALLLGRLLVRVFQETRGILVSAGLSFVEFRLLGIRAFGSFTSAGLEGGRIRSFIAILSKSGELLHRTKGAQL